MKIRMLIFAIGLASGSIAISAFADDVTVTGRTALRDLNDPDTIRVPYSDLLLATADGADALHQRVDQAVRRGCGRLYGTSEPSQRWQCIDIAWDAAAPQMAAAIARAHAGAAVNMRTLSLRFARR